MYNSENLCTAKQDDVRRDPMTTPKVSVLTTAYNPGDYLDLALESLYGQSFADFEHILVDNGCADDSIDRLTDLDPRCRLTRFEQNIGRTPALQRAFEQATGEYVAILDADDVWHASHLQRQIETIESRPNVVLVGTWCRWIDENGKEKNRTVRPTEPDDIRDRMSWENPISNSSALFRRDVAVELGGYDEDFPFAQDFDLWLKMVQVGDPVILPEYLTDIRVLTSSVTHNPAHGLSRAYDEVRLYRRAGRQLKLSRKARRSNRISTASMAVNYGNALRATGKRLSGTQWILWAMLRDPLVLLRRFASGQRSRMLGGASA